MTRWKPDAVGRLIEAALVLFDQQGYDNTTVADIAARAGLTRRTFFRYFPDKREVLFSGSERLEQVWLDAVTAAPEGSGPMAAVEAGLDAVAGFFAERHAFARIRAGVVAANPELRERELIKLEKLTAAIASALEARGVSAATAALAAETGVRIFHLAFGEWVAQDDPAALRRLMDRSLGELRRLLAG